MMVFPVRDCGGFGNVRSFSLCCCRVTLPSLNVHSRVIWTVTGFYINLLDYFQLFQFLTTNLTLVNPIWYESCDYTPLTYIYLPILPKLIETWISRWTISRLDAHELVNLIFLHKCWIQSRLILPDGYGQPQEPFDIPRNRLSPLLWFVPLKLNDLSWGHMFRLVWPCTCCQNNISSV